MISAPRDRRERSWLGWTSNDGPRLLAKPSKQPSLLWKFYRGLRCRVVVVFRPFSGRRFPVVQEASVTPSNLNSTPVSVPTEDTPISLLFYRLRYPLVHLGAQGLAPRTSLSLRPTLRLLVSFDSLYPTSL